MEKSNIADFFNLKCEERNHYRSNCLMAACTYYGDYKTERACEDLISGKPPRVIIQLREQLRQQII